jgi:pyridoxine kinase
MQKRMKQLVQKADVITPNYTEACFLLGEQYEEQFSDIERGKSWLRRLGEMGPAMVVITGIPVGEGQIMNFGYERKRQLLMQDYCDYIPAKYPGTGDIYASILLGVLLQQGSLEKAMKMAGRLVAEAIKITVAAGTPNREGVLLERALPELSRAFWHEGS